MLYGISWLPVDMHNKYEKMMVSLTDLFGSPKHLRAILLAIKIYEQGYFVKAASEIGLIDCRQDISLSEIYTLGELICLGMLFFWLCFGDSCIVVGITC